MSEQDKPKKNLGGRPKKYFTEEEKKRVQLAQIRASQNKPERILPILEARREKMEKKYKEVLKRIEQARLALLEMDTQQTPAQQTPAQQT